MTLHSFSPGQPTPFGPLPEGASLLLGPTTQALIISLHQPTAREGNMLHRGRLRVGLAGPLEPGGAVLPAWHFAPLTPAGSGLWFDTPFHIGRNPAEQRALAECAPGEARQLQVVVQDEAARFRGGRSVSLSPAFSATLEKAIADQLRAAQAPGWDYLPTMQKVLDRWDRPEAVLRDATLVEIAGRARWTGTVEIPGTPVS